MGSTVIFILLGPQISNIFTIKVWNNLPSNLRNKSDAKVFGKIYKTQLLDSITNDQTYVVNNAYYYLYRPMLAQ